MSEEAAAPAPTSSAPAPAAAAAAAPATPEAQNQPEQKASSEFKVAARTSNNTPYIEWKDSENLRRFLTPNGKIQGRKKTGLSAREQRMLAQAIKRARYMGLLPYTSATL